MRKIIILSIMAVALFSCCTKNSANKGTDSPVSSNTGKTSPQASFDIIKQDSFGGRETAGNIVIKSQQELNAIYSELNLEDTPNIDFTKRNVVVLFMGQKSSGGHSIGIKSVTINGNTATVEVITKQPEGMALTVMTAPYCIANISKTDKVVFK